ncbi:MAG: FkbM family methyltransferase [Pedosphaera sp.]|nr:FkbM family methyltransferase [Pedosphaera sp.]
MKALVKQLLLRFGIRISRSAQPNRFQAMEETLSLLKKLGFAPGRIIDGGANQAQWAGVAAGVFPDARLHLIEPQPACQPVLERFTAEHPGAELHAVALTEGGKSSVTMFDVDGSGSSGAFVGSAEVFAAGLKPVTLPATTLDELFAEKISAGERVLLKLDLEGHELPALRGAGRLLKQVEVFVTEAHVFAPAAWQRSVFGDIAAELQRNGFELFDIASLSGRGRDARLRIGDFVFVNKTSALLKDREWS